MKTNKIIEVCIWVLVLMSLISGMFYFTNGRNWISYKKPVASRSTAGLNEMKRETADISKIDQIELRLKDADVVINSVEGNEIEVIEYARDNDEEELFEMTQKGDTLKFERKNDEHFGFFFGDNGVQHYVEVKLPKDFSKHLVIENSSGDVALVDSFVFDELELGTTSGNIAINEVEAECEIGATSGDIYIEKINGSEHNIGATSGKITVKNGVGNLNLGTSSGDIFIEKLEASKVDIGATSGNITLKEIQGDLEIGTTSGNIFMETVEGEEHEIECTSGNVKIEEGKGDFQIETTSGDVFLKKVNGSKHQITTTSGDIDIEEGKGDFDTDTNSGDVRKENITE